MYGCYGTYTSDVLKIVITFSCDLVFGFFVIFLGVWFFSVKITYIKIACQQSANLGRLYLQLTGVYYGQRMDFSWVYLWPIHSLTSVCYHAINVHVHTNYVAYLLVCFFSHQLLNQIPLRLLNTAHPHPQQYRVLEPLFLGSGHQGFRKGSHVVLATQSTV